MKIPKISFEVVINGPVAIAGSIPFLFKIIGTKVPINAEMIITPIKDIETVKVKEISWFIKTPNRIKIEERRNPLIKLKLISFNNLDQIEPLNTSLAIPWTIIADDWTPTFPAIAAINGV